MGGRAAQLLNMYRFYKQKVAQDNDMKTKSIDLQDTLFHRINTWCSDMMEILQQHLRLSRSSSSKLFLQFLLAWSVWIHGFLSCCVWRHVLELHGQGSNGSFGQHPAWMHCNRMRWYRLLTEQQVILLYHTLCSLVVPGMIERHQIEVWQV